jgi:O-antigen/teichoic acid export membrane protein
MRTLARLAWLALPLGIVVTLDSLRTSIPRFYLERHLGEAELGIFAAMAYLRQAGNIVAVALGLAACPRMAKHYVAWNGSAYRRLLFKLVGVSTLLGAAGVLAAMVAGREILTILYKPEYAEHLDVFVILIVAAGIDYVGTAFDYGMTAARYFWAQMPLFAAVTVVTTLVCLWQIPAAGLRGAALAVLSASIVYSGGSVVIVAHALRALRRHVQQADRSEEDKEDTNKLMHMEFTP